jgi:PAS domain S-box-containing protein
MASVLVVDDIPTNRQLLATLLGYRNHHVIEASDGLEALDRLREERPDLIITDMVMPRLNGYEFVERLRNDPQTAGIPVILFTASYIKNELSVLAKSLGDHQILVKPCEPEKILRTVDEALSKSGKEAIPSERQPVVPTDDLRSISKKLVQVTTGLESANIRMSALLELGIRLASETDRAELVHRYCRSACNILGAERAGICILDQQAGSIIDYFSYGRESEDQRPRTLSWSPSGLLAGVVSARSTARLSSPDIEHELKPILLPGHEGQIHSFLAVPIFTPTTIYGFLYAINKLESLEFSIDDERIACTLASQLAVTYENLSRFERETATLRAVFARATAGIAVLNRQLVIVSANPALLMEIGLTEDELPGKSVFAVIHGLPEERLMEAAQRGIEVNIESVRLRMMPGRSEREIYWDVAMWPVEGTPDGRGTFILRLLDVSERVKLAQQREDFVATLTHDLKTPLAATQQMFDLVLAGKVGTMDTDLADVFSMIRRSTAGMLEMLQDLLDVYRYDAGAAELYCQEVDVAELVVECAGQLGRMCEGAGVKLQTALPPELHKVWGDRTAIKRVLTNLIGNSIKFTPGGGTVEVEARNQADMVLLAVKDTGCGIAREDQPMIFQRFWRRSSQGRYPASTGLGLYLSKQIVEAHGGTITFESTEGTGTTFSITLPSVQHVALRGP